MSGGQTYISPSGEEFNIKKKIFLDIFGLPTNKRLIYVFYCTIDNNIIFDISLENVMKKIEEYTRNKSLIKHCDISYNSRISNTLYRCAMIGDICYDWTHFMFFDKSDIKKWMDYCDKITETTS